jgi:hypothetical protein
VDTPETPAPAPRWFQRVFPVTGLAIVLVTLAALVVPAFRDQVELSTSRQSEPYVELYFAHSAAPDGQAVCTVKAGKAVVRFVIGSHLAKEQPVAYRVAVDPTAPGVKTSRATQSVRVAPDASATVTKLFALPRKGYTVSVSLPALGQQLRAHCPGQRR